MNEENLDEILVWAEEVESLTSDHAPQARIWLGETVLDAAIVDKKQPLRAYAHCTNGIPGAVTVVLINLDSHPATILFEGLTGNRREVYQLTAPDLLSPEIHLNGAKITSPSDIAPEVIKKSSNSAWILLPGESYTFVVFPDTQAPACADK